MEVPVLAVTGGVATGKSLVTGIFRELGAAVVDADELAHQATEPGAPALEEIRRAFGPEVFTPDRRLDRKALARRVFSDAAARRRLEALIHPRVRQELTKAVARLKREGPPLIVLEVPLLFETGEALLPMVDRVLVVTAEEQVQLERLRRRNGLTEEEARARVAAQMPLAEKVRRADYVVENGGTPEDTRRQVLRIWEAMRRADRADRPR